MHELHLVKNLFSDLLRIVLEKKASKITKVYLRMGEFTEVNEEILRYFFKENSKDTPLDGATLDIEKSPTRELRLLSFDWE